MSEKRFVWHELVNIRKRDVRYGKCGFIDRTEEVLIGHLVEKLKLTFIGCNIVVNPLKTYLIIDWS